MSYQGQHTGAEIDEVVSAALAGGTSSGGITPINVAIYCYYMGDENGWDISIFDAPSNLGELVQAYINNAIEAINALSSLAAYQWNLYLVGGADSVYAVVTPQCVEVYESYVQLRFSKHQFDESDRQYAIRITTSGTVTGYTYSATEEGATEEEATEEEA